MSKQMTPEEQIEKFWYALWHSWDIEPREYFEREAPRNGFGSPLAMAVHHMWKREAKVALKERVEREGFDSVLRELMTLAEGKGDGTLRFYIKQAADVAKNMEHAAPKEPGPVSTGP